MPHVESPHLTTVLASINAGRDEPLTLSHRFEVGSGAGAHEVTLPDGPPLVLKWWPETDRERQRFDLRHARISRLASLGWPIPDLVDHGTAGTFLYELWSKSPGSPCVNAPVPTNVVIGSSELVEQARGAAVGDGTDWPGWLRTWIADKLSDLAVSPESRAYAVRESCREAMATADIPPGRDLIHGDFTPANLLVDDDQIVAVVDLDDCRDGDGTLDLIDIAWDLEGWDKASEANVDALWAAIVSRVGAAYGRVLLAFWIAGTLAWAIGTDEEEAKISLARRAWKRFDQ